ncbi:MAG: hypothetical protein Q9227_005096 [Pyrenula ochraceoflavens]
MDLEENARVKGRLALVTGASGGIGNACARQLAAEGANLALTYSTHREPLDRLVEELKTTCEHDIHISAHQVDLSSPEQIKAMFKEIAIDHPQSIDILVANAGSGKRIVNVWDVDLEQWEYTQAVNVRAPFLLVKGVVEGMKAQRWGRIVFISSIAAYGGGINGCHYAASKGGLTGMMRNLASKLAQFNISVNDVAPAMIGKTYMIPSAKWIPDIVRGVPLGRLGEPEEVANVVTMYTKTGYVTGQSLVAGGGLR